MKMTPGVDMSSRIREKLKPRIKHYEPEIKLKTLSMFESGNVPSDTITDSFGITIQTAYNWRKAYKKDGMVGLEDSPKGGRRPDVSKAKILKCAEAIKRCSRLTAWALRSQVATRYGRRYTANYMWRVIDNDGYNYKKANPVHVRAATNEEIEEWCKENMPTVDHHISKGYVLLVCDEAHPEMDNVIPYGYAKGGERVYITYYGAKQRLNIVGVVVADGRSLFCKQVRSNSDVQNVS